NAGQGGALGQGRGRLAVAGARGRRDSGRARAWRVCRQDRTGDGQVRRGAGCGRAMGLVVRRRVRRTRRMEIKNLGAAASMIDVETGKFTVAVFQDIAWADRGIEALKRQGIALESISILGKASPDLSAFVEKFL